MRAQSSSELHSPVTARPNSQPTEDIFRVVLQLLSVLMRSVSIQEKRGTLCLFCYGCAMAAAEGMTDGCYRWAGFKGVLLHHIGFKHFWEERVKPPPRHRRVQSIFPHIRVTGKKKPPAEVLRRAATERGNTRMKYNLQLISLILKIYRRPKRCSLSTLDEQTSSTMPIPSAVTR